MDPNREMINDIYKMTKENNQMLHGMRRRAFVGGFVKILVYAAVVFIPIYFYMTYLNSTVQNLLSTVQQMQDAGTKAQVQILSFQTVLDDLKAKIPFVGTSTKSK